MTLRQQYLNAVAESQARNGKQLVSKSATGDDPQIIAIRDKGGTIIGYAPAEHVPLAEVQRTLKQPVSKSADTPPDDENAVFDNSAAFPWSDDDLKQDVEKSAAPAPAPDDVFESAFPVCFQSN